MAEVTFDYESLHIDIQCKTNDKMKDIINKFLVKIEKKDQNILYYLYNGTRINEELTFNEQANDFDKNRKKMNILVTNDEENKSENNIKVSNDIICPDYENDGTKPITIEEWNELKRKELGDWR